MRSGKVGSAVCAAGEGSGSRQRENNGVRTARAAPKAGHRSALRLPPVSRTAQEPACNIPRSGRYIPLPAQRDAVIVCKTADRLSQEGGLDIGETNAVIILTTHREGDAGAGREICDRGPEKTRAVRQYAGGVDRRGCVPEGQRRDAVHQADRPGILIVADPAAAGVVAVVRVIFDRHPAADPSRGFDFSVRIAHGLAVRPPPGGGAGSGTDVRAQVAADADRRPGRRPRSP